MATAGWCYAWRSSSARAALGASPLSRFDDELGFRALWLEGLRAAAWLKLQVRCSGVWGFRMWRSWLRGAFRLRISGRSILLLSTV